MKLYGTAATCKNMDKNIGDLVPEKRKQNQGKPTKLLDRQKRSILRQAKLLQEELGNFIEKRVLVWASIQQKFVEL